MKTHVREEWGEEEQKYTLHASETLYDACVGGIWIVGLLLLETLRRREQLPRVTELLQRSNHSGILSLELQPR
jgi:hypothetical protein